MDQTKDTDHSSITLSGETMVLRNLLTVSICKSEELIVNIDTNNIYSHFQTEINLESHLYMYYNLFCI
jgi:redox-regulated HSP33 family molecular chaperone